MTINVKIKKLRDNAIIPTYGSEEAGAFDLYVSEIETDSYGNQVYKFGISMEIPKGYVGLLFPRSSNCKTVLYLTNSVGIIDSDYRGEITAKFKTRDKEMFHVLNYNIGDRVAQMMIVPNFKVNFEEVEELSETKRGSGGYGSTGK